MPKSVKLLLTAMEGDGLHWSQTRTAMFGLFLEAFKLKQFPQKTGLLISTGGFTSIVIRSGSIISSQFHNLFRFNPLIKTQFLRNGFRFQQYAMFIALQYLIIATTNSTSG